MGEEAMNGSNLDRTHHVSRKVGEAVQKRINALKIGQKMQDLPEHLWHESFRYYVKYDPDRKGGPNLRMIRLDPDKPSLTVTGYIFNKFVHPFENRYITPREAARLQGFPDRFLFSGTLTSVQRQVGNAVPVPLAKAIANQVLNHIMLHHPDGLTVNKYTKKIFPVISLFSGAGGMDLGFHLAKHKKACFNIKLCLEYDIDCCKTLKINFKNGPIILNEDISQCDPAKIFQSVGTEHKTLPIIIGGPPCQAFSQAGKQNGTNDPRGRLIFQFLHFVETIQPTYFVMENVSNLRAAGHGELLNQIEKRIDRMGYNMSCNLLCAADYGAPQLRRRLIFIGVKKPFPPVHAPFPTHGDLGDGLFVKRPYVNVREAFAGLPSLFG